jgi:hypothetical protein
MKITIQYDDGQAVITTSFKNKKQAIGWLIAEIPDNDLEGRRRDVLSQ